MPQGRGSGKAGAPSPHCPVAGRVPSCRPRRAATSPPSSRCGPPSPPARRCPPPVRILTGRPSNVSVRQKYLWIVLTKIVTANVRNECHTHILGAVGISPGIPPPSFGYRCFTIVFVKVLRGACQKRATAPMANKCLIAAATCLTLLLCCYSTTVVISGSPPPPPPPGCQQPGWTACWKRPAML